MGENRVNNQTKFQTYILFSIVIVTIGILGLVAMGKTIDPTVSGMINSALSGLIGALGGHAISESNKQITEDTKTS
jgi:hypothetical protein